LSSLTLLVVEAAVVMAVVSAVAPAVVAASAEVPSPETSKEW
jgi:hypothetical protein